MPLLDHFRPPLFPIRKWESFHSRWATSISDDLNARLPKRFFTESVCRLERHIERDVAEANSQANGCDGFPPPDVFGKYSGGGPRFHFATEIVVEVRDREHDHNVVGVVEFVGPDNKAENDSRCAFASKVATHLSRGIGVLVIDVVTSHDSSIHSHWIDMTVGPYRVGSATEGAPRYAVSYRPRMDGETPVIDVWARPLAVGFGLPELPLGLKGYGCVPVDLDATYTEACVRSGLV